MKPIISTEWYPVTYDFGVIEAPIEIAAKAFTDWKQRLDIKLEVVAVHSSLEQALSYLEPLCQFKNRTIFIALANGWSAFFQNGIQGSDPFPPMSYMACTLLDTRAMRICSSNDGNIWEVYASSRLGGSVPTGYLRSICACREDSGRWMFHQSGEPFSFEELGEYSRTRIRDRFNDELFDRYLRAFGLEIFDPGFFSVDRERPAYALIHTNVPAGFRKFSLQEVREGKPWKK
jgi:hypothetical protein